MCCHQQRASRIRRMRESERPAVCVVYRSRQGMGEYVGCLASSVDVMEIYPFRGYHVSDEMVANIDVFRASMVCRVGC